MRTQRAALISGALAASFAVFLFSQGAFAPLAGLFPSTGLAAAPTGAQWIGALLLGFGLAWTTVEIRAFSLKIVVAVLALLETALLPRILGHFGILWLPFTALSAGILGTCFGLIYGWSAPGRRRRALEAVFGGRVKSSVLRQWLDSNEALPLEGGRREASLLVCRIFNRDRWAGALSAQENVALTRGLLDAGSALLKDAGALLMESDGEHWVAAFGAVLPERDHAAQACRAALALKRRLEGLDHACRARWHEGLDYGIAIHSGAVSVGVAGGQFFVTGEPMEFCRRLCLANRGYGTRLLAGPQVVGLSQGAVEVRPVELIWNGANATREEIYEVLAEGGGLSVEERARREEFWKGVILWRRGRGREAAARFEIVLRDTAGADALVSFYRDRATGAGGGYRIGDR